MAKVATMTFDVTDDLKSKIGRLAEETHRTPSAVAQEGLDAYVDRQLWMLSEIDKGLEDFRLGRVVSHEDAMARLQATIDKHKTQS